jgi:hypothetical protein
MASVLTPLTTGIVSGTSLFFPTPIATEIMNETILIALK